MNFTISFFSCYKRYLLEKNLKTLRSAKHQCFSNFIFTAKKKKKTRCEAETYHRIFSKKTEIIGSYCHFSQIIFPSQICPRETAANSMSATSLLRCWMKKKGKEVMEPLKYQGAAISKPLAKVFKVPKKKKRQHFVRFPSLSALYDHDVPID